MRMGYEGFLLKCVDCKNNFRLGENLQLNWDEPSRKCCINRLRGLPNTLKSKIPHLMSNINERLIHKINQIIDEGTEDEEEETTNETVNIKPRKEVNRNSGRFDPVWDEETRLPPHRPTCDKVCGGNLTTIGSSQICTECGEETFF